MLLSKGLNFGIYTLYPNIIEVQKKFENLHQEILSTLDHNQRTEFKRILLNLYSKCKSSHSHLRKHDVTGLSKEKFVLDSLRKEKSIIVSKPAKAKGEQFLTNATTLLKWDHFYKIKRFSNQLNLMIILANFQNFKDFFTD